MCSTPPGKMRMPGVALAAEFAPSAFNARAHRVFRGLICPSPVKVGWEEGRRSRSAHARARVRAARAGCPSASNDRSVKVARRILGCSRNDAASIPVILVPLTAAVPTAIDQRVWLRSSRAGAARFGLTQVVPVKRSGDRVTAQFPRPENALCVFAAREHADAVSRSTGIRRAASATTPGSVGVFQRPDCRSPRLAGRRGIGFVEGREARPRMSTYRTQLALADPRAISRATTTWTCALLTDADAPKSLHARPAVQRAPGPRLRGRSLQRPHVQLYGGPATSTQQDRSATVPRTAST